MMRRALHLTIPAIFAMPWPAPAEDAPAPEAEPAGVLRGLLDHTRLTFNYGGRDFRLTNVYGEVVKDILA